MDIQIRFHPWAGAYVTFPFLKHKEWWTAKLNGSIYYLTDPELPFGYIRGVPAVASTDVAETRPAADVYGGRIEINGNGLTVELQVDSGSMIDNKPSVHSLSISEFRAPLDSPRQSLLSYKVRIDPQSSYGKALKGLTELINGMVFRFAPTNKTLNCLEYQGESCMILCTDKSVESFDLRGGSRTEDLQGLLVPKKFLI